ncbi:MAG TPA: PepSY domain-containing protein [Herpetosiphonaceae bacterium]|nr:PepSY domain-containing protein [Herpetosiphonaceae bacterium]
MATTLDQARVATASPATAGSRFYRAIWRWHFYAGLLVVPFMLMLAITGTIYLFKPQLDQLMYRELLIVEHTGGAALPATEQLAAVQAAYPGATVASFRPSDAHDHSAEVSLATADGRSLSVFVNPYTAGVLGERDADWNLQQVALKLHGELLIGPAGDRMIELAACWAIILLLTGMILWWPRQGARVWGTLLPRLRGGRRVFWRDLHAVPGFYAVVLILFLLVSGLPWTGFWGKTFSKVAGDFPAAMWNAVPESTVLTGSLNEAGPKIVPWAAEAAPLPQSALPGHEQHQGGAPSAPATPQPGVPAGTPVDLDAIIALAQSRGVVPGYTVSLPQTPAGVYTVSVFPDDPADEATIHIDRYSGAVLADIRWSDYGWAPKAVEMGIALHEGKYFGLANQLLALFAALMVVLLSVTGVIMWWKRRPDGRLGAPAAPQVLPRKKTVAGVTLLLGVLFPLVGVSLIAVGLLDWLVIRRIPRLRQVFA